MKIDILLLCPMHGNGGIASWTKQFLSRFPDERFGLFAVNIAPSKDFTLFRKYDRLIYGISAFFRAIKEIKTTLCKNPQIKLMHITTAAGYGAVRDFFLGWYCKKNGLKIILHCRFGSIKELFLSNNWKGWFFRKSLKLYDQIWVLDKQSARFLLSKTELDSKVFLTPNPIKVPETCDLSHKSYRKIGFVGNLLPTKGIFELLDAVMQIDNDTELYFVGDGTEEVKDKIKAFAKCRYGKSIWLLGRLSNEEAVKFIDSIDILALPTYFWGEAFPISILEAMSRGKLVISCPRAAIPDMLMSTDGTTCGILVQERSSKAIVDAINWCQTHHEQADAMCQKAYEKAWYNYRLETVYDIYRKAYTEALR